MGRGPAGTSTSRRTIKDQLLPRVSHAGPKLDWVAEKENSKNIQKLLVRQTSNAFSCNSLSTNSHEECPIVASPHIINALKHIMRWVRWDVVRHGRSTCCALLWLFGLPQTPRIRNALWLTLWWRVNAFFGTFWEWECVRNVVSSHICVDGDSMLLCESSSCSKWTQRPCCRRPDLSLTVTLWTISFSHFVTHFL